jgi:membrane protein
MMRKIGERLGDWVWEREAETQRASERTLVRLLRLAHAAIRDLADVQFTMRAMGLVYTTLLSVVPFLAISFSLLKALGVHNKIEPLLLNFLAPLGASAPELVSAIIGFVNNIKVGVLGSLGVALLLWAVISLIQKVESGCNFIWKVDRPRSFARRFSEYLSVLIVGPVVVFSALALTATVSSQGLVQQIVAIEPFGTLYYELGRLIPYLLVCGGFTALYLFIPNTRVRLGAAVFGGLVAGIAWQTASWIFALFVRNSTQYNAIYSGFAILIFLLIWLYVTWLILLIGCHIAFLWQHPEHLLRRQKSLRMGGRTEEQLALLVMCLVGQNMAARLPPWHEDSLARHLRVPPEHLYRVLDVLLANGFLALTGEERPGLLAQRDLASLTVRELLDAVRANDSQLRLREQDQPPFTQVSRIMRELDHATAAALGSTTIRDLALGPDAPGP